MKDNGPAIDAAQTPKSFSLYSYEIITIQILHSTILPLITLLHYGDDTMRSERQ